MTESSEIIDNATADGTMPSHGRSQGGPDVYRTPNELMIFSSKYVSSLLFAYSRISTNVLTDKLQSNSVVVALFSIICCLRCPVVSCTKTKFEPQSHTLAMEHVPKECPSLQDI